jgi:hypothetical protein
MSAFSVSLAQRFQYSLYTHGFLRTQDPCSGCDNEPFRFLDIPPELRLIVYEHIKFATKRHFLNTSHYVEETDENVRLDSHIVLVSKTLPCSILVTCTLIKDEAQPILKRKLDQLRDAERYHMIIDTTGYLQHARWNESIMHALGDFLGRKSRRMIEADVRLQVWSRTPESPGAGTRDLTASFALAWPCPRTGIRRN